MFKSKTEFKAFNKQIEKVSLDLVKVRTLAKAGVKKLAAKPEERTSFHLVLNYFTDESGKAIGDFFDLGTNKRLTKHFEQVEMKPGKPKRRASKNPKEASAGEAYVREDGGKKLVCFEPSPASKIPNGKWPKILKNLRPFLAGFKGVVVIGGQVVGEELSEDEGETPNTDGVQEEPTQDGTGASNTQDDGGAEEAPNNETAQEASTDTSELRDILQAISTGLKETLPKSIIPKIKSRTVTEEDQSVVQELLDNMASFAERFEEATDSVKASLQKIFGTIQKQQLQVQKILDVLQKLLSSNSADPTTKTNTLTPEENSELEALLAMAKAGISQFDREFDRLKKDLESSGDEPIEGGEALLKQFN